MEVRKLPESKWEKEERSSFEIPNRVLILSHSMFWFNDIVFEDQNDLLVVVNKDWYKWNNEQERNRCTEHHRHVDEYHKLREPPMSMELLSTMEINVFLNWATFSFVFYPWKCFNSFVVFFFFFLLCFVLIFFDFWFFHVHDTFFIIPFSKSLYN